MPPNMRRVFSVLLACLFIGVLASGCRVTAGNACYRGTVGKSSEVTMTLQKQEDGSFLGGYRHDRDAQWTSLEGNYNDNGQMTLKESSEDVKTTGFFVGELDTGSGSYRGTWSNADGVRRGGFDLKRIAKLVEIAGPASDHYRVTVQYAVVEGDSPFVRALNPRLRKDAEQSFKELEKGYRELRLKHEKALEKGSELGLPFSGDVTIEVMYCDSGMISILYTHNSWTGGFHSNELYSARTYYWDGNTLRELATGDMIGASGWAAVTKLCIDDLSRRGAFGASDAQLDPQHPPVMNAVPSGLVITFAPYEVGPYVQGTWTVVLPYVAVKPYLQSNTPVEKLASQWMGQKQKAR